MKQKLLLLLTALLASASMWAKVGDTFTRRGVKYEVKTDYPDDLTAWVVGHESWLYGDVAILENINGYDVTGIDSYAFYECTDLTSVTIPNGVKEIGMYAFQGCSSLKSVSIPGSVELIRGQAFLYCTALTSITFPEGMTTVYGMAFYGCTSLISVTIPASMTSIEMPFYECPNVLDVYCYADADNLEFLKGFGLNETTKFHVDASQLDKFEAMWTDPEMSGENRLNVTFVGDLNTPVLTDSEPYTRTVEKTVSMATYKKTLGSDRVGKHQAWMVPFDYTITAADLKKFTFYKINMIANSPAPGTEAGDDVWVFLSKMKAGDVLRANMPYVYKPLDAVTDYQFITTGAVVKAPATEYVLDCSTTTDTYKFYPTYMPTSPSSGFDFYYVNINGGISYGHGDDSGVTVGPYRWYIRKTSKFGSTTYAREMHFVDGEEGNETGIQTPSDSPSMGSAWYDLQGRKLDSKPTQKGMYIVNGKKVYVK